MATNVVFDPSKMMPFGANKRFHLKLNLDTSQPTDSQKAHNFTKHINNILEQLYTNLLMSQITQKNAANLQETPTPSYKVDD